MNKPGVVTILIFAVIIVGAAVMSNDLPGRTVRETDGVVKGTAVVPRDDGPSPQVATVALAEAGEVRAAVNPGVFVHPGQSVRVRERQRIISGATSYEVFAVKEAK